MAELTVPQIDFSALGQLPAIYKQGQADNLRQQTLASLGQGGTVDATNLLKSGDLSLAQLGMTLQQQQAAAARQTIQDARQASNDQFSHGIQSAQLELSKRAAARADEGPVEQAGYRAQVAQKYGIDPNTPEGRAYVVSGKLPDSLATGGEIATASQRAQNAGLYGIEKGTPEFKTYVLTGKLPDSVSNGGNPEVGLNPAYGVGADGKPAAIQFSKSGQAVQTKLPDGFSLSKEPIKVDLGTHIQLIDPITRTPIGNPIAKNLAGVEREKAVGEATGAAEVNLPQTLATSAQTLKTIEELKNHPGLDHSVGLWSAVPNIPGSQGADFAAKAAQLKGQTFLQAYQTLRGSGAITDIEGKKGEDAIGALDRAQSKTEYIKSLNDLGNVIKAGMLRARAKAQGPGSPVQADAAATPASTTAPNVTSSGVRWSVE